MDPESKPVASPSLYDNHVAVGEAGESNDSQSRKSPIHASEDMFYLASTHSVTLQSSEQAMIEETALTIHNQVPNLYARAAQVSWGGPHTAKHETNWWYPAGDGSVDPARCDLDKLDGGHVIYSYLFIMKWSPHPNFPFRLCQEEVGCTPDRAFTHTLEWREKYKPWMVPPSVLEENKNGYVYHKGFGPNQEDDKTDKHSTVWLRCGHKIQNEHAFFRGILNAIDRAVADSLVISNGRTGKFNVVVDCSGFSLLSGPSFRSLKQAVTMLQDHYPNVRTVFVVCRVHLA
jgi:hypothetical protein